MKRSSDHPSKWWMERAQSLRDEQPRVEVFLRSLVPSIGLRARQDRILNRLAEFDQRGLITEVNATIWGRAVPTDGTEEKIPTGGRIEHRVQSHRAWARAVDVPVELPFEEQTVSSSITDEEYGKIVLPQISLGVYADETLRLVLPCTIGGETYSIEDFLSVLEQPLSQEHSIETSA